MTFFGRSKSKPETAAEAALKSSEGPVLRVTMGTLHLATLFYDGTRYVLIYHEGFKNANIAPFNPEAFKMNDVPDIDKCYYSSTLWHSFSSRIPANDRPDFKTLLSKCGLTGNENPLVILSKIGSVSISKPWKLEVVYGGKAS